MRITIETDERGPGAPPTPPAMGDAAAIDAGTPPTALMQLATMSAPGQEGPTTGPSGTDAGAPPGWLLDAVQATGASPTTSLGNASDAGPAPDRVG